MTRAAEELLIMQAVKGTVFEKVKELERAVTAIHLEELELPSLDTVTDDLGLIEDGEYRAGNEQAPGRGFTGVRIGGPFSYLGHNWHIVGLYMDILKFALSAEDGAAYAAGGNLRIDEAGLRLSELDYALDLTATNNSLTRTTVMRLHALTTAAAPRFEVAYSSGGGAEMILNPGFETGDLTNWNVDKGAWAASTDYPETGTYCVRGEVQTPDYYAALYTDRILTTAGKKYVISGFLTASGGSGPHYIHIKFYDAASGGSWVGSAFVYTLDGTEVTVTAPAGALSCEVHLYVGKIDGDYGYFDDLSLSEAAGATVVALDPALKLESTEAFEIEELSDDPSSPDSGYRGLYAKSDGFHEIDDAGDARMLSTPVVAGQEVVLFPGADWADDVNDNYRAAVADDLDIRAIRFFIPEPMEVRMLTIDRGVANDYFAAAIMDADDNPQIQWWAPSTSGILRLSPAVGGGFTEVPKVLRPGFYWFAYGCYDASDTFRCFAFFSRPSFVPILNDTVAHFGDCSTTLPDPPPSPLVFPGVGTVTALNTWNYFPVCKVEGST